MKIKKKLFGALATLALLLPLGLGMGQVAKAAGGTTETPAETQNVTIHKRQFSDDQYPQDSKDLKKNTGKEMTDFGGTALEGAGFTAYDMTSTYWAAYEAANGDHEAKEKAAIEATIKADLPTESTKATVFALTDKDGDSTQALPVVSNGEKAIYRFVETTKPAGVVSEKSQDFILGLPVYDEATAKKLDTVHVYPKNEVKTLNLGFTKYGVDEKGAATTLPGAKFKLRNDSGYYYKDGAFTAGEEEAEIITSDKDGLVSVPSLTLKPGKYIFSEIDSGVSTSEKQKDEAAEIYHYGKKDVVTAIVDDNMKITYHYFNANQGEEEGNKAKAYNYKVPAPTKKANDNDLDIGQTVTFTITQLIPNDISDYTEFKLVDNYNANLELISDELAILKSVKINDAPVNDVNPTYKSDTENNTFTVGFDPKELVNYAGQKITFTVDMKLKPKTELGEGIDNTITFNNNFTPKTDKDTVKTYGHSFVKKDLVSGKTLQGAEFVVKSGDKFMLNTDGEISWVDTQEKATVLSSDDKGEFRVDGLAKTDKGGDEIKYELVETKSPEGYVLPTSSFGFVADNGKTAMEVDNKSKGTLPSTGSIGIYFIIAAGVVAAGIAVFYFTKGRKQTEA